LKRPNCPFCGGLKVIGNGYFVSKMDGKSLYKRWKCKDCKRTFSRRYWRKPERKKEKIHLHLMQQSLPLKR
jgi:transposase-like protein